MVHSILSLSLKHKSKQRLPIFLKNSKSTPLFLAIILSEAYGDSVKKLRTTSWDSNRQQEKNNSTIQQLSNV